ncbi:MAG: carbohydrate-binding family 6 protein [Planctomycetes bacterium B3_Pla]|nr:MAG: carbohydrate-binding family 6 protein [Planctomycetes bacterium B3_Pla]
MKRRSFSICAVLLVCCLMASAQVQAAAVTLLVDGENPQAVFASGEIQKALRARGHSVRQSDLTRLGRVTDDVRIVLGLLSETGVTGAMRSEGARSAGTLKGEGYSIRVGSIGGRATYWAIGADAAGVMYGGLELAEVIRVDDLEGIEDVDHNPYMAMRGTKFNCPLDVRTPSYTDVCDAAQNNIVEMWNLDFWKEYIDNLARYRYNYVSLWSLHPFPSLVKVPDYPDVALDDVKRSKVQWNEYYSLNGRGFDAPEIMENLETLKKITIDEKIDFWRQVMRYGKQRNVDFYFVTWNIFVNGTEGKYGITDSIDNEITVDYFRKSVKQMFLTYPDLAGIGLTTGENIPKASFEQKEDWAFKTYAQGVLDAAREQPGRKFTLIHRQHQTGAKDIARKFRPVIDHKDVEFIFSFKYAKAHVFSSTTQPYHTGFVKDIQGQGGLKTIWTLRNDDAYRFRWGAPDFVREFIRNIPYEVSRGFYYGSDQYIWGREFMSTEPESPRQIEIVKHWYHWMIWGRLGYNPNLSNERFVKILQQRYPSVSGQDLFTAWQQASMIYPMTTGFHWGSLDFQWYIEACKSHPGYARTETGFHDVNRFITLEPHKGTDNISIPDYVENLAAGRESSGTTPVEVSDQLHGHADKALKVLDRLDHADDKELRLILGDIRAVALLGKYYAHKIRGATELAIFRKTDKKEHQDAAIRELNRAAMYWRLYTSVALGQYKDPLWTNRVGRCNWRNLLNEVLKDVTIAGGTPRLKSMAPTPGGTILKGEAGKGQFEWTFDAPKAGTYVLELRYAMEEQGQHPAKMTVNGKDAGDIILWTTGGKSTWAWDRKPVVLKKGKNTIKIVPKGTPLIDHLNVLHER